MSSQGHKEQEEEDDLKRLAEIRLDCWFVFIIT